MKELVQIPGLEGDTLLISVDWGIVEIGSLDEDKWYRGLVKFDTKAKVDEVITALLQAKAFVK